MPHDALVGSDETQPLAALGRAIRELREARAWTAADLAHATGLQRSYVTDLERGTRNPTYRTLLKVATAFNVPVSDLIARAEDAARP